MTATLGADQKLALAVARRRTFAIISHPDAGKTTLTEKLLLYGGAIHLAGSVKARRAQRHVTSDWMQLEQERGISVTSSVMQFEYAGYVVNLLDTPGHGDFSEDTYRTLIAADSAVMLLDNRRGVEERTRQLFEVCKRRRTPIFTFVNKADRWGEDPIKLISDVEADLGIECYLASWPIFRNDAFVGVYDRIGKQIHLFERDEHHGARMPVVRVEDLGSAGLSGLIGEAASERLRSEIDLLDHAGHSFDHARVLNGDQTPVFFGSALTNFGVKPFLRTFLDLAPPPTPRSSSVGTIEPETPNLSAFVFKIQANMDPRHRDRIAFMRIVSGRFEAGMEVNHVRTGKKIRLASPQTFMARDRTAVEEAWPGDIVGILDRGNLRIGDTLSAGDSFHFSDIPRFPPERFARVVLQDPLRRKQLDAGLRQLTEERSAQVFFTNATDVTGPTPILGAIGQLQFDVMLHRLEHEYGVPCRIETISGRFPRWVTGPAPEIQRIGTGSGRKLLYDSAGNPLILFDDEWSLRWAIERETTVAFHPEAP